MITSFKGEFFFLSNFYGCPINYLGLLFPTVEHAFQATKTKSAKERRRISLIITPGSAKRAGRKLDLRKDWETIKVGVMTDLLELKFIHPQLRRALLNTGEEYLVEGNNWGDTFWGACDGKGKNKLGLLLMELRDRLAQ